MNFGARLKEALLHWSMTLAAYLIASVSILIGGIERDQGDLVIGTILVMIMFLLDLAWSFRGGWTTKLILSVVAMNVWGTLYFGVVYTARDHPKTAVAEATAAVSSEDSAPGNSSHHQERGRVVWIGQPGFRQHFGYRNSPGNHGKGRRGGGSGHFNLRAPSGSRT